MAGKGREQDDRNSFFKRLRSNASGVASNLCSTLSSSTASALSEQDLLSATASTHASRQPSLEAPEGSSTPLGQSLHGAGQLSAEGSQNAGQVPSEALCNGNGTAHQVGHIQDCYLSSVSVDCLYDQWALTNVNGKHFPAEQIKIGFHFIGLLQPEHQRTVISSLHVHCSLGSVCHAHLP